jgi:hypothetical protein
MKEKPMYILLSTIPFIGCMYLQLTHGFGGIMHFGKPRYAVIIVYDIFQLFKGRNLAGPVSGSGHRG